MRDSHWAPFIPVGLKDSRCTLFDGPPRILGLGIQICNGKLTYDDEDKPIVLDLFSEPSFDMARGAAM